VSDNIPQRPQLGIFTHLAYLPQYELHYTTKHQAVQRI